MRAEGTQTVAVFGLVCGCTSHPGLAGTDTAPTKSTDNEKQTCVAGCSSHLVGTVQTEAQGDETAPDGISVGRALWQQEKQRHCATNSYASYTLRLPITQKKKLEGERSAVNCTEACIPITARGRGSRSPPVSRLSAQRIAARGTVDETLLPQPWGRDKRTSESCYEEPKSKLTRRGCSRCSRGYPDTAIQHPVLYYRGVALRVCHSH